MLTVELKWSEALLLVYEDEWAEAREEFALTLQPADRLLLRSHAIFYIIDDDCE